MARRGNRLNPHATTGYVGERRQEDIDREVDSQMRLDGPRTYRDAYAATVERMNAGESPDAIREALRRVPHLQPDVPGLSPKGQDARKAANLVEEKLIGVHQRAVEDALARRPAKYEPL